MQKPTIIFRVRLVSEPCAACGAVSGERCTVKSKSGKAMPVSWTHARGKAAA